VVRFFKPFFLFRVFRQDGETESETQTFLFSLRLSLPNLFHTNRGFWLLTPFQVILFVGIPIAYTITAAISFQKIVALVAPGSSWGGEGGGGGDGGLGRWIFIFMLINLCVVQIRSFHSLSAVSMIGTLASVFYALVAFIGSLVRGTGDKNAAVSYQFGAAKSVDSTEALVFNAANAIATIAFAYGGEEGNGWGTKKEETKREKGKGTLF
jgi:hypothetical protein